MVLNRKDLEEAISKFYKIDLNQFTEFIFKFKNIIDTGKLAEFYCSKLFDLELIEPRNSKFDAKSRSGEKIEIKHRFYTGKIPPGMEIDLEKIDYVYYAELDDNLLPKRIYRIRSKDIDSTTGKRVSFKRAFKENKRELIFQG